MNKTIRTLESSPLRGGLEGSLILKLKRYRTKEKTCDGCLYDGDGEYICDTAEATPHMLKPGRYVLIQKSRLIKKGNGVYALRDATIYVGTYLAPGVLKCSAQAYDRLYQRIKKARQRRHKVVLLVEQMEE